MNDPAVAAADRVRRLGGRLRESNMEAAAREALAPLRTKMESLITEHGACQSDSFSHGVLHALNELAEYVYSEEEL